MGTSKRYHLALCPYQGSPRLGRGVWIEDQPSRRSSKSTFIRLCSVLTSLKQGGEILAKSLPFDDAFSLEWKVLFRVWE